YDRTESCSEKYWAISKDVRIEKGLRFDVCDEPGYSGARVIEVSRSLLSRAFRGAYPILTELHGRLFIGPDIPDRVYCPDVEVLVLEQLLSKLESKLAAV